MLRTRIDRVGHEGRGRKDPGDDGDVGVSGWKNTKEVSSTRVDQKESESSEAAVVGGYICMVKVRGGTERLALDSTESEVGLAGTLWEREE